MGATQFYELIGLAERLPNNKKILSKKMFYDYTEIDRKEKKAVQNYVKRIELSYLLTESTINIQTFIDSEYYYEGVMFITVQLKEEVEDKHVSLLSEAIHSTIPNPVVITFSFEDKIQVSSCMKRLNKVDKEKIVLERIHYTDWFRVTRKVDITSKFLEELQIENLSFTTFYNFYQEIDLAIKAYQDAHILGTYRVVKNEEDRAKQEAIVVEMNRIENEINGLKRAIKKESQFNKKVELNLSVQKLKKQLDNLKNNILKDV